MVIDYSKYKINNTINFEKLVNQIKKILNSKNIEFKVVGGQGRLKPIFICELSNKLFGFQISQTSGEDIYKIFVGINKHLSEMPTEKNFSIIYNQTNKDFICVPLSESNLRNLKHQEGFSINVDDYSGNFYSKEIEKIINYIENWIDVK
jgi:hypothetical protein